MFPTMVKRIEGWRDQAEQLTAQISEAHADYYRACGCEPEKQDMLLLRRLADVHHTAHMTHRHLRHAVDVCTQTDAAPHAEQGG